MSDNSFYLQAQHNETMVALQTASDFSIMKAVGAKVTQDGNQYCCLYGENLHDGIAGFGDTPYKAVLAFNNEWNKSIKSI